MRKRPDDTHINNTVSHTKIDKAEDSKISRGFWRYVVTGYAIGMLIGAILFVLLLLTMDKMELRIPLIFIIAALAQIGTGGGLVGAGIYVSLITDRDDDDDNAPPGGGKKERVKSSNRQRSARPVTSSPVLQPQG